jgi:hypothetical protein
VTDVALTTRQETKYQGNDWWHWSIWIDGPAAEMAGVRGVTYLLHPTFPNPRRRIDDASTGFRLDSAGWGGFTLKIEVERKDGTTVNLTHELELEYPDEPERDAPVRGMTEPRVVVYLAYSAVDARVAESLHNALLLHGIEVLAPSDLRPGEVFENAISQKVRSANVMVALVSDASGRTMHSDIQTALKNRTRTVVVELSPPSIPIPTEVPRIPLNNERDVDQIIESLVQTIRVASRTSRSARPRGE